MDRLRPYCTAPVLYGPPARTAVANPKAANLTDYRADSVFEINVDVSPEVKAACQFKVKRKNAVVHEKGQLGDTTYEAKLLAAQRKAFTVGRGKFIASLGDFTMSLLKTGSKTSLWPGVAVTTEFEPLKFDLKKMEMSVGEFSLGLTGDITSLFFPDGNTTTKIEIIGKLTVAIDKVDWRSLIKAAELMQRAQREAKAVAALARQARALELEVAAARARGGERAAKLVRHLRGRLANVVKRSKLLRDSLQAIEKQLQPLLAGLKGSAAKLAGNELAIGAAKIIGRALRALNALLVILDMLEIARYAYAAATGAAHWQLGGGGSFANAAAHGVAGGHGGVGASGQRSDGNNPKADGPAANINGAAPAVNGKGTGVGNGGGDSDGIGADSRGTQGPGDDSGVYTTPDQGASLDIEQTSAVPTYGVATGVEIADEELTATRADPETNVSRPGDDVASGPALGSESSDSEGGLPGGGAGGGAGSSTSGPGAASTGKSASAGEAIRTGRESSAEKESAVENAGTGQATNGQATNGPAHNEAGVGNEAVTEAGARAGAGTLPGVDVGISSHVRGSSVTAASPASPKAVEAKPKAKPTATPLPTPKKVSEGYLRRWRRVDADVLQRRAGNDERSAAACVGQGGWCEREDQ
ncbi:MAG: hypothetical protein KBG15_24030 [Kofleriaceae bacterium]|nr:hypothetical protein [Kofleriaceae bacterium]